MLGTLIGCDSGVRPAIAPSSEIELKVLGAKPYPDAKFGLGYAFAHGFSRVDLNGSTYRQLSPGLILRSPQTSPLPPYVVVMDQRVAPWLPESLSFLAPKHSLQVLDRASGRQIATFTLPRDGWPGDQAGKWLAGLLKPEPHADRSRQFDVSASATVHRVSPTSLLQPGEVGAKGLPVKACEEGVSAHYDANSDHGRGELRTSSWTLLMPYGLREVHCAQRAILLFGGHRQEDLEVVAINSVGTVIGRGFVRNDKIDLGHRYHFTKIVALEEASDQLIVRQAHFVAEAPVRKAAAAVYETRFSIPCRSAPVSSNVRAQTKHDSVLG